MTPHAVIDQILVDFQRNLPAETGLSQMTCTEQVAQLHHDAPMMVVLGIVAQYADHLTALAREASDVNLPRVYWENRAARARALFTDCVWAAEHE